MSATRAVTGNKNRLMKQMMREIKSIESKMVLHTRPIVSKSFTVLD